MENGETSASATLSEPEDIKEKEKKHVKVRLSVFFDGTLNNRTNTKHRVEDTAIYQQNKTEDADNSYEGDNTNVEKIERYIEVSQDKEHDIKFAIYIEGPGTEDDEGDSKLGYGIGKYGTGIEAKVQAGIAKSIERISKHVKVNYIIDQLTLDVFGFSRGAAGARNYIFEALKESDSLREGMENKKRPIRAIEIYFAGLFDTVASHGAIPLLLSLPNTKSLKLHAVREAKKVIHLVAAEEHRKYFSLTDIASAGGKGLELFLPGVHSDIGGGYRDEASEGRYVNAQGQKKGKVMVVYKTRYAKKAAAERDRLIASGWYRADEITLKHIRQGRRSSSIHLEVTRRNIRHHYSRIPLHIMTRYARESGIDVKSKLDRDEDIPDTLSPIQQHIEAYIARVGNSSTEADWQHNDEILRKLRRSYLHFSAQYSTGMKPRFSEDDDSQRKRLHFPG